MEPSAEICLFLKKRTDLHDPYYTRILQYKSLFVDESQHVYTESGTETLRPLVETRPISDTQQAELNALEEAYNTFMDAKRVYESAVDTFWKSETGMLCKSILVPDPATQDRMLLREKIKELEARLVKSCLCIKHQTIEISGYNHIHATYVVIMYEDIEPPHHYADFRLVSWNSRTLEEVPKLWTNKMALERKKEMELVYVFGDVLPPYRIRDKIMMKHK